MITAYASLKKNRKDIGWLKNMWYSWKSNGAFSSNGCHSDSCDELPGSLDDGCPCNNYNQSRNEMISKGYRPIATCWKAFGAPTYWSNGKDIITEVRDWGR